MHDKNQMTQTIAASISLYDLDLDLWLERMVVQLKAGDFHELDVENLIEELEGLSGSNKREIESRLIRLIEHILKRCYVNMPDCYRGWEVTIISQRDELRRLLRQSPSLKRHFLQSFDESLDTALELVKTEYDQTTLPNTWQFSSEIEAMLTVKFWE